MKVSVNMFDPPSGTVRGVANVSVGIKGKEAFIGNAHFPTGAALKGVSMRIPQTLSVADLRAVAAAMVAFADAVEGA